MKRALVPVLMLTGLLAGLSGYAAEPEQKEPPKPVYSGIETHMLQDDLIEFRVAVAHADAAIVTEYADCAAAQYALIRGFGYARQVRTLLDGTSRMMRAQAAYLFSRTLPAGDKTIDARQTVADCQAKEIPTV